MPATRDRLLPTFTLRLIHTEDGHCAGCISGAMLDAPFWFTDLGQLILALDVVFDENNYPQAFQRARRFGQTTPVVRPAEPFDLPDEARTVRLTVLSRRSSSWQGYLIDENERRVPFSSTLDLMRMLSATA